MQERLFVSTTPGLEPFLEQEARTLWPEVTRVVGGVEIKGPEGIHREANLKLRTASRVALRTARGEDVDTSGQLLYRRGYRQEVSRAPMRETLAAGILLAAGYTGARPLWDPCCGSGTFGIEGAWIALRRAPGSMRHFAFESFPSFKTMPPLEPALDRLPAPIWLSDLNAGALGTARRNARRAGLEGMLKLERLDATKITPAGLSPGLIVANLPYGIRVSEASEVKTFLPAFSTQLQREFGGWRAALLTLKEDARLLPFQNATTHRFDNGGLSCVLTVVDL